MNESLHPLGLASRTFPATAPARLIEIAREAGFGHIGITVDPKEWDPSMTRQIRRQAMNCAIDVLDVEAVRIRSRRLGDDAAMILEAAAEIGARFVLVIGHDADMAATAEAFRELCGEATKLGLEAALEFMPFRGVATLRDALHVVSVAGHAAGSLLIDNHHLARAGATPADLASVPPGRLAYAQLCDVPASASSDLSAEAIMQEALERRTLPGAGSLPCREFVAALPPGTPISLEILGTRVRAGYASDLDYAVALREAALRVMH